MAVSAVAGLVSAIGAAASGLTVFGLAATSIGGFAAAFALGATLSALSRALIPQPKLGARLRGVTQTSREPAGSRKLIYGQLRVGGQVVFIANSGTNNEYLHLVIVYASHEIESFEEFWFNNNKVYENNTVASDWSDYVTIAKFDGSQTTADSTLTSVSSQWTSNHILNDMAYAHVRLKWDQDKFPQGVPNISAVIKGKKVYDPRDSNQSATDSSTWTYSQNPALCVRDYLVDTKYGLGEDRTLIDSTALTAAANLCEESISLDGGGTQDRYRLNGQIDTANQIKDNIEQMLSAMGGTMSYSGGKYFIRGAEYITPTVTFDEADCVADIQLQTKQSRRGAYNGVKGIFVSEEKDYKVLDYPAQISSTYATEDGDPIYLDMPLPFVTNNVQAQRIAKIALLKSRQQTVISMVVNLKGLRVKVGDTINVSNTHLGYSNKVFEVIDYSLAIADGGNLAVNLTCIETASAIYDWTTSDQEDFLSGGTLPLYDGRTVDNVTSLQHSVIGLKGPDGKLITSVDLTWTAPTDAFVEFYVVTYEKDSDGDVYEVQTRNPRVRLSELTIGSAYTFTVKAQNLIGVRSSGTTLNVASLAGDTTAPAVPTSPSTTGGIRQITVEWTEATDEDLALTLIYYNDTDNLSTATRSKTRGEEFVYTLADGETSPKTKYFWLSSIDYSGNESAKTSSFTGTSVRTKENDIADGEVTTGKIENGAVTEVKIEDGAVTADKITVNELSAISADVGSITAGTLQAGGSNAIPDANDSPSGSETGAFIDLDNGKFVFGDANKHLLYDGSTLLVKGELEADILDVIDATITGQLTANAISAGAVTVASLSAGVFAEFDDRYGTSGGFYVTDTDEFFDGNSTKYVTVGTVAHSTDDIYFECRLNHSWSWPRNDTGDKLKANVSFEYSTDNSTWTTVPSSTTQVATATGVVAQYATLYSIAEDITYTMTGSALTAGNYYFRVKIVAQNSTNAFQLAAFGSGSGVPIAFEVQESSGISAAGGNADTLDGLDSTQFLRSDTNDTFDGNLTITGDLILQGGIDQYNVTNLTVDDKTITVNAGSTQALSDGAGLIVDRGTATDASITWDETNDKFDFTNPISVSGIISGGFDVANFYSGSTQAHLNIGRSSAERFNFYVTDGTGFIRYYQDETDGTDHSFHFQIQSSSTGTNQFYFNKQINVTNQGNSSQWNTAYTYSQVGHLPLAGGTLTGRVTFPTGSTTKPILAEGFFARTTSDTTGTHDIWGISETFNPSASSAADQWGIQWSGNPNEINFIGAGQKKLSIDLDTAGDVEIDGNRIWDAGDFSSTNITNWNTAYTYSQVGHLPLSGGTITGGSVDIATAGQTLTVRSGNVSSGTTNKQIIFGYASTTQYAQNIRTRHNSGVGSGNAIDFYLWDQANDASTDHGSMRALKIETGKGVDLVMPSGAYQLGGSTVIASTRRFYASNGTTVKAAYSFDGDSGTGISRTAAGRIDFLSSGAVKAYIKTGTSNPISPTMYVDGRTEINGVVTWTGGSSTNANTAYGWGDHSTQNYAVTTGDTFTGLFKATGGSLIEIQNQQDGGTGRGIMMWDSGDTNWGIYMGQAGGSRSLAGSSAASGLDGRTSYAVRFRVHDSTGNIGFLFENSSEEALFQVRGDTGEIYSRNNFYPSNQTTNYVSSTRIANWQTAYGWGDHSTAGYLETNDNITVGTISSGAITSSASVIASGNSNSFGNTTISNLTVTTVTASGSITASGNSNSFGNTTVGTLTSGAITSTGTSTIDAIEIDDNLGVRFGHANEVDTNDGRISAGRHGTGLNIVGVQTTSGTGRQVRVWGALIDDAGHNYIRDGVTNSSNLTITGAMQANNGYKIGSTTVINSSRNFINVAGITTENSSSNFVDLTPTVNGQILHRFWNKSTGGSASAAMRIANSGNTNQGTRLEFSDQSYYVGTVSADRANGMEFYVGQMTNPTQSMRMQISTGGNVAIGTGVESGFGKLHVKDSDSGATPYQSGNGGLTIERNGRAAINLLTPNTQDAYVFFGDPQTANAGFVGYEHSTDLLVIKSQGYVKTQGSGLNISGGNLQMAGVGVIDSARNIQAAAISSAAISGLGKHTFTGDNSTEGTLRIVANSAKGARVSHVHYGANGDWYIRSAGSGGSVIIQDGSGVVSLGTISSNITFNTNAEHITFGSGGTNPSWSAPKVFRTSAVTIGISDYSGVQLGGYNGTAYGPRLTVHGTGNVDILEGALRMGTTTVIASTRRFYASNGTVAKAAFSFDGESNTGMYKYGTNQIGFTAGGNLMAYIQSGSTYGLVVQSKISATGGNSDNWNAGYTYSTVGHLPLAGGTMTGGLTVDLSTDSAFVTFERSGSEVGKIVYESGTSRLTMGTGNSGLTFIDSGQDRIVPRKSGGGNANASIDLGDGASQWRELYLSGGLRVNSQLVIDSSRNIANVGTISSSAHTIYTTASTLEGINLVANVSSANQNSDSPKIQFNGEYQSNGPYIQADNVAAYGNKSLKFYTDRNGGTDYTTAPTITLTLDYNGNAQFAGTISSGAITSSGTINAGLHVSATTDLISNQDIQMNRSGTSPALTVYHHQGFRLVTDIGGTARTSTVGVNTSGVFYTNTGFAVNTTTVIDSSRVLQNVTLKAGGLGSRFEQNSWHQSADGYNRFYFASASHTYFRTGSAYVFRDNGDVGRATISAYGGVNLLSGGDGHVASNVALAVGGTTVIDSSRNLTSIGTITTTGKATIDNAVVADTLHIRGDANTAYTESSMVGGISLWGPVGQSTSQIMFKQNNQGSPALGNHGFLNDQYATYFVMDTNGRGWVFRNATTNTNVASISTSGGAAFDGGIKVGTSTVIDSARHATFAKVFSDNLSTTADRIGAIKIARLHPTSGTAPVTSIDNLETFILSKTDGGYGAGTKPSGGDNATGIISLQTHLGTYYTQLALQTNGNNLWIRSAWGSSSYGSWEKLVKENANTTLGTTTTGALTATNISATSLTLSGTFTPTSISATSTISGSQFRASYGSESAPAFTFKNDDDTGMYGSANRIHFAVSGDEKIQVQPSSIILFESTTIQNELKVGTIPQTVIDTGRQLQNVTVSQGEAEYGQSLNGNFGQWLAHNRYAASPGFNSAVDYWGWNFVQGNINAPHTSSSQWYRNRVSLGNQYGHGISSGDYWLEIAHPRTTGVTGQMYIRACESGSIGEWREVGSAIRGDQQVAGRVGIGASPESGFGRLHIKDSDSGATPYQSANGGITVERNGRTAINLLSPANSSGYLFFADPQSAVAGYIGYDHSATQIEIKSEGYVKTYGSGLDVTGGNVLIAGQEVISGARNISAVDGGFSGFLSNAGGAKLEIQNSTDGGNSRGIFMWNTTDTNWGIYMSTAGSGKSLAGGSASSGLDGRTSHGIRFRVASSSTQIGFLFENGLEQALAQITADSGNFLAKGNITAYASDERLKTNIKPIERPLEKLMKLRGVEFDWIDGIEKTHGFIPKCKHETGVIAQQVEQVIPDAISPAPFNNEYKTVEHTKIISLLIESVRSQQETIESLTKRIEELENGDN